MNRGFPADTAASPIIGSENNNIPTSRDVHLYSDPDTCHSSEPIQHANCEGLEGGENAPIAVRSSAHRLNTVEHVKRKARHALPRDIAWANTPETEKREYAVTELYPRLLYTFSDVVVFVLRNSKYIPMHFFPMSGAMSSSHNETNAIKGL